MIPNDSRRGEPRRDNRRRPQSGAGCKNTRVNSTASFVGRFYLLLLEAALCSDPNQRDQNIRPAGPPWRNCALPGAGMTYEKGTLSVRQHAPDFLRVRWIDFDRVAKMPHAFRLFRAEQMALECMRAHDFTGLGYVKALRRATMSF
jgi:hypothetical protein